MLELPSHNVGPLVESKRKISMALDPICVSGIHNGLTCGSNCDRFSEITFTRFSNPGNFGSESLNVFFFSFEGFFGNKHWEVSVFYSVLFNQGIEKLLYFLPDAITPGSENITT